MSDVYDSTADTLAHVHRVQQLMSQVMHELEDRSRYHDGSKLEAPEKEVLDREGRKLAGLEYGTPEYDAALASVDMKPFLDHHYSVNSHHPQHYAEGVAGMSLLDVLEMVCDWKAATERVTNGSITKSLEINKGRFGITDQLHAVIVNTVHEMGWEDGIR